MAILCFPSWALQFPSGTRVRLIGKLDKIHPQQNLLLLSYQNTLIHVDYSLVSQFVDYIGKVYEIYGTIECNLTDSAMKTGVICSALLINIIEDADLNVLEQANFKSAIAIETAAVHTKIETHTDSTVTIHNMVGTINNKNHRHAKKATRFSVLVAGKQGLGKTTLLTTLFDDNVTPKLESEDKPNQFHIYEPTQDIQVYSFETEDEDGNKLVVEAIDTPGFNDDVDPQEVASKVMQFIENTYDEVFEEESRVRRNPKFEEHRVHAVLYLIEPTGHDLKAVDAEFIKKLSERSNVIPVIAKADSLTSAERQKFKSQLTADFNRQGINAFYFADLSDNELGNNGFQIRKDMQPLSVIGSVEPRIHETPKGRPYPWGMAESKNPNHCDLSTLSTALFTIYREELKEITEDALYEKYRTEKLEKGSGINVKKSAEKLVMQEQLSNSNYQQN